MIRLALRRLGHGLLVLFAVVTLSHFMLYLSGDPVLALLTTVGATEEQIEDLRRELGYDRPVIVQYADYVSDVATGDFGTSLRYAEPNLDLVMERLPRTFVLAGTALGLVILLGIPIGIISALYRDRLPDRIGIFVAVMGQSIPNFVLGPLLILLFAVSLRWLPAAGIGSPSHLILPSLTLALYPMARIARILRASMLEVLQKDYVTTAHSKGLSKARVVARHVLRNSALPVITIFGLQIQAMLGGAVIVESIFGWPGLGQFAVQALINSDFLLVQAIIIVAAVLTIGLNMVTDIVYAWVDPRIHYA